MKRTLAILTLIFAFTIALNAQHLKFMGIPIDGTITQFQQKLAAKGFTISPDNKHAGVGMRIFKGTFSGEKCNLYVYYNPTTKLVESTHVIIPAYSLDAVQSKFNQYKSRLNEKYASSSIGFEGEHPYDYFWQVLPSSSQENLTLRGVIGIGIIELDDPFEPYELSISYSDSINVKKNKKSYDDDL